MNNLEILKSNLIDKITASQNEKLLNTIISIFEISKNEEKISFNIAELEMIKMSEEDIKYGRLHSQDEIDKLDAYKNLVH